MRNAVISIQKKSQALDGQKLNCHNYSFFGK